VIDRKRINGSELFRYLHKYKQTPHEMISANHYDCSRSGTFSFGFHLSLILISCGPILFLVSLLRPALGNDCNYLE